MSIGTRLPDGSLLCIPPMGGFPSAQDCAALRPLIAQANFTGTGASTDLIAVQAPTPVPQGKHWIISAASCLMTQPGVNAAVANVVFGLYLVNAAKFAGNGMIIPATTGDVMEAFLISIGAIATPTFLTGLSANTTICSLAIPWLIVPGGYTLVGFNSPPAAGAGTIALNFMYMQRDNPSC